MDVQKKLIRLMEERGWSAYMLSKYSGLDPATVRNYTTRGSAPSIASLEAMCAAFGITLSQFFDEEEDSPAAEERRALLAQWSRLSSVQKKLLLDLMRSINA